MKHGPAELKGFEYASARVSQLLNGSKSGSEFPIAGTGLSLAASSRGRLGC